MAKHLEKGDHVSWKSHGGTAEGKVLSRQTSDTKIKGHQVRASEDDPQYIVRSDNGGKASHKPTALTKL
ncbi:MAG: DUF2945 domain-containing protein [Sphingomonadales bacterium]|nr:MAG: DUF2945 domain-containing protein [Sphingomonadales bacterium]